MSEPIVFVPNGKQPTLLSIWMPLFVTLPIFILFALLSRHLSAKSAVASVIVMKALVAFLILFTRAVLQVDVSLDDKSLTCVYLNAFGAIKTLTLDLPTAKGKYRYEQLSISSHGWRLTLSNGSWLTGKK